MKDPLKYSSLEEFIKQRPEFIKEYRGLYFIKLRSKDPFDEIVWTFDKRTKKVNFVHLIDYFSIEEKAKDVDFSKIRSIE